MKSFVMRFLYMATGLTLYALGIVIMINTNMGYAPWEVFHVGLARTTGLSIGVASIIAGIVIVIPVTLLGEKLGFGTIVSMILPGIVIDILFYTNVVPVTENIVNGIVMLITGLFIITVGLYFYIKSAFGVGPRDNLIVVLARKTKFPIGLCRSMIELLVTVIGWLLGGMVGIGTVISVIAIGFFIQIIFKLFKFDVTAVKHETLSDTIRLLEIPKK